MDQHLGLGLELRQLGLKLGLVLELGFQFGLGLVNQIQIFHVSVASIYQALTLF